MTDLVEGTFFMKIMSNLFLVLILVSSLCGQARAMDQCKEAAKIIGLGMGCGAVLGAANVTYRFLRFNCEKPTLSETASCALQGAKYLGAPAVAVSLLGPGRHLKVEDVVMPMGVAAVGLFAISSVRSEYYHQPKYQWLDTRNVDEPQRKNLRYDYTILISCVLLPSYLVYKRYQNA